MDARTPQITTPYELNEQGQPIGLPLPGFTSAQTPESKDLLGQHGQLTPLIASRHAAALFHASQEDSDGRLWTYLPFGPFADQNEFTHWLEGKVEQEGVIFFCISSPTHTPLGFFSFSRIQPEAASIELANVYFSPQLKHSTLATEAVYLMLNYAFELGYRRCEWKCNALNQASIQAALRFGFTFEGTFRNAAVVKGRSRDTAWFSICVEEWPALKQAFLTWLSPDNFNPGGLQKVRLSQLTAKALHEGTEG
ncbi:GNAT family protein [Teredinibacter sp. KSP-S5-2]|uniref:GNAT family N-acetyltransferase n=1 Tax=Teredinibacter sp. KSP-S5-2 TaxID=3034506 RepID=UPI002934D93E|nr:GNAT family protein [Teredinibacter sp. KSP-S5-2]WNO09432.1 GNAT family protein [Teredinibacter sp. KSP-S5-2]